MSIVVKSINKQEVKQELKNCPKVVRDYVKSLENICEMSDHLNIESLKRIKELHAENNQLKPANWQGLKTTPS